MPKSKPVAHTTMSNGRSPSAVSIPLSVMRTIGVCLRSTSETFGLVERLVVAGHEGGSLLAEAMVLRDELLRRLGVLDDAPDLLGDELAPLGVGGLVEQQVGVVAGELREAGAVPHRLEERPPLAPRSRRRWPDRAAGWRNPAGDVFSTSRIASKPARSCACSSGVIGALLSGVHQLALRWYTVSEATSSAMAGIDLHAARSGADDGDPLAGEVDRRRRPQARVVRLAPEVLAARHVREVGHRENAGRGDEEPRPELRAVARPRRVHVPDDSS